MSYQGNLGTIRAEVVKKLRLTETDDDAAADQWINLAYQQVVQETGCLQTSATAALTSGVASYTLPAPVAQIRLLTITYADGSFSNPLLQITLEEMLQRRRANLAVAQNVVVPAYALAGQNQLEIWPTPGAGQTAVFWYAYLPDELTADADEPALMEPFGSKLLEYGALVEGARFKKDVLLMSDYEQSYAVWMAKFQAYLNRREGESAATFRVRGGQPARFRFANRSADVPGY